LIINIKLDFARTEIILTWAMLGLGSEARIIGSEPNKSLWSNNSISEIRFHLDETSFSDVSLCGSESNNTWGLSKVSIVSYDLNTSSFGDCDLAFISAEIDADGCRG